MVGDTDVTNSSQPVLAKITGVQSQVNTWWIVMEMGI